MADLNDPLEPLAINLSNLEQLTELTVDVDLSTSTDSSTASIISDLDDDTTLLRDSRTATNTFGSTGDTFTRTPKKKFLFYVKFFRPDNQGGSDWINGLGAVVKSIDRPRITFNQDVLNQYNRKRIVQTNHEFEPVQIKFHDTVDETMTRMFAEYFTYYYADSTLHGSGTSVYDVVMPEHFQSGKWGYRPPEGDTDYNYFFSHISVYQMFAGKVVQFDLINPKIQTYNPDEYDYAGGSTNEIIMTVDFEGIVFHDQVALDTGLAEEMGITLADYYDVDMSPIQMATADVGILPDTDPFNDFGGTLTKALKSNIKGLVTGETSIGGTIRNIGMDVATSYDANRGLAIGKVGLNSVKNIVNGKDTKSSVKNLTKMVKGTLFGKPGGLF